MLLGAVLLLAGSVVFGGSSGLGASVSSGDRAAFFPVAPARLLETRSTNEGGAGTVDGQFSGIGALGAGATLDLQVTGRANVPPDATSVVLNVTAVDQQGGLSFVTVFPTGTSRPNASSLNPSPGAPPVPNGVTATIGAGGKVSFFTLQGPVHLLADVVGFYAPHDHDDRYYTKAQSDSNYYTKAQVDAKLATTGRTSVSGAGFATTTTAGAIFTTGCMRTTVNSTPLAADINLPLGATVTSMSGLILDIETDTNGRLRLFRGNSGVVNRLAEVFSTDTGTKTYTVNLATPELVDAGDFFYVEYLGGSTLSSSQICGVTITYTVPSGTSLASVVTGDETGGAPGGVPMGSEG